MLLTVDQLRTFPGMDAAASIDDEALQTLLDAAEQAILRYAGPVGQASELLGPMHGELLMLSRRAESIDTIIEHDTTLDPTDYELRSSGYTVRRLHTGTNPRHHWHGRIDVTYVPYDDAASRSLVQVELVKLDIAFNPTLAAQTIGSWSETYATGKPYPEQRDDILASLSESFGIV